MKWYDIEIHKPEEGKEVLASDGINFHIADFSMNILSHKMCDYSCKVTESLYWMPLPNQPERSKREDLQKCEMRCSEHCGNTVRDK